MRQISDLKFHFIIYKEEAGLVCQDCLATFHHHRSTSRASLSLNPVFLKATQKVSLCSAVCVRNSECQIGRERKVPNPPTTTAHVSFSRNEWPSFSPTPRSTFDYTTFRLYGSRAYTYNVSISLIVPSIVITQI